MMSNYNKIVFVVGTWLAAGFLVAGCMAAPDGGDTDAHTTGLTEAHLATVPLDTVPLAPVSSSAWRDAPQDCHDLLPGDVHFELVRDGLVVALDALGNPLCVDTLENIQQELQDEGRISDASDLEDSYLLAVGLAMPSTDINAGDPTPQPSCDDLDTDPGDPADASGIDEGDPSPQPSSQPMDPNES